MQREGGINAKETSEWAVDSMLMRTIISSDGDVGCMKASVVNHCDSFVNNFYYII